MSDEQPPDEDVDDSDSPSEQPTLRPQKASDASVDPEVLPRDSLPGNEDVTLSPGTLSPESLTGDTIHSEDATLAPLRASGGVDQALRQSFEQAWVNQQPRGIASCLPPEESESFLPTLVELVGIDLEFQWKQRSQTAEQETVRDELSNPPLVEDYLNEFSDLNTPEIMLSLLQQEFWARARFSEEPEIEEYHERFPDFEINGASLTATDLALTVGSREEIERARSDDKQDGNQPDGSSEAVQYFGEYELLQEIARGGMGVVYKARQSRLNRLVALKMILSGQLASEDDVQRFYIEAEAAASLEHPGIVPIFEIGEHEGQHFFSMGFIDGAGLDVQVKEGPMAPREAAALTQQVCEAIAYAHSQNVIHRDLKPANVLIDGTGQAKVTDFGLAKKTDGDSDLTGTGQILGTPGYMPPEQASGETDTIGPAADIYSLGAILYALLTGRPPFQSANVMDTLLAVLEQEPVAPRQLNPALDQDLETICLKCLQKDAGRRYGTTDEVVAELGRYLNGEPIHARPISKLERGWRWCKRKPALAGLGALAAVMLLTFGIGGPLVAMQQSALRTEADEERQLAETAQEESEKQTQLAEEARLETRRRMAHANVINGTQLVAEGNLAGALSWFTEALRLDEGIPEREQVHRQRLARVLAACPKPKHVWIQKTPRLFRAGFSPDYQKVFTVHLNGTIQLWDLKTGESIGEPIENDGAVLDVAFDKTGDLLATAVLYPGQQEFSITRIWDLSTRKRLTERYRQEYGTEQVAFHPHKKQLMTASGFGNVVIWDTETGKPVIETIEHPRERPSDPFDIQRNEFSPDGSLLLTASTDSTVRLWDTSSGLQTSRPLFHADRVNQAHFSPDGKRVATASNDNTARLWDVETGLPITPPLQHAGDVLQVVFSADGRRVATISENQDARVWDAITGEPLTGYLKHHNQVTTISFSAEGQFVATGCIDGKVRLWSVGSGQLYGPLMPHPGAIQFVEFHPDGRHLLTTSRPSAGADGTEARIWDLAANKPRSLMIEGTDARHAQFIPHSTHVLIADQEHRLRVHDTKTGSLAIEPVKTSGDIRHFEFNDEGTKLITATAAGIARVWDAGSLKPLTPAMQNNSPVNFAHFNHDGKQLVTITKDDAVRVWNANSGTQLAELFDGTGPYESLDAVFHPDGQLITFRRPHEVFNSVLPVQAWVIGESGMFKPGDLKLDSRAFDFKEISEAAVNPRGDQLLFITTRYGNYEESFTAGIYDRATASKIYEIPYGDFYGVSFSNNGKLLLIYDQKKARVWNVNNGQPVSPWIRTGGRIRHAIFSPNGLMVGTASQLTNSQGSTWGTVCVWDARSGQPLTTGLVHNKAPSAIDFSTDSNQLLTRADAVRLWQIGPTPQSLDELTSIAQFLSSARLDETATLQPLTTEEQRTSWQAVKENRSIRSIGTDQQATQRQHDLYELAIREDDLVAMRHHQDILLQAEPKSTNLLWRRSLTSASLGDLETAVTDLKKLTTLVPDDNCGFSANYVMLLLRQGDTAGFRRECESLLKRYNDTTDAMIAERVAKTCCLEPVPFPVDDIRIQLAGRAAAVGESNPFNDFSHLAYGMAGYRSGQFELALEQLKPLGDMTQPLPPNFTMPGKVLAKFFEAMSEHQLGHHQEAERGLQIALKYNRARGEIKRSYGDIYDWLRCDIIESEAISLIRNSPADSP